MILQTPPRLSLSRRLYRRAKHSTQSIAQARQRQRVAKLIADPTAPDVSESEADFDRLQSAYGPRPPYGYDPLSIWSRAAERASLLLSLPDIQTPGKAVLDAGAGEGMLGVLLETYGHHVTLADLDDWRAPRARDLDFIQVDLDTPDALPENAFDLICSFNTLEHVLDPETVLANVWRSLRPGGLAYFDFGPLFASPWGLHAYGTIRTPFPQYLFSQTRVLAALKEFGINDLGQDRTELQPLNRWRLDQFQNLWRSNGGWEVLNESPRIVHEHLDLVEKYPTAFRGRGLKVADLVTSNLAVVLKRTFDTESP